MNLYNYTGFDDYEMRCEFMAADKVRISIYVTPEEKRALQKLAERNVRSMASEIRMIIVEKLNQEKGLHN